MTGMPFLLWAFPAVVFLVTLALGLVFNAVERAQRARLARYDRFGSITNPRASARPRRRQDVLPPL